MNSGQRYVMLFEPGPDRQAQAFTETRLLLAAAFPIDTQGMVTLQQALNGGGAIVPEQKVAYAQIQQQLASCH